MDRTSHTKATRREPEPAHHVRSTSGGGSRLWADAIWGIGWGLGGACFFSLYVMAAYALWGTPYLDQDGLTLTLSGVLVTYFSVGLGGGAVIGLLRPLLRSRAGAFFVGTSAAIPLALAIGVLKHGQMPGIHWRAGVGLVIIAAGTGGIVAALVWRPQTREEEGV
jgi:hypothetical protein